MSGSSQAAEELADACNQDPGFRAGDGCLEVFSKASVAAEPSQRALDDPTSRLGLERSHALRTGDDFNGPFAEIFDRREQFWALIDAIGEDVPQCREHAADDPQQRHRTVIVLGIGGLYQDREQRTFGIGDNVALAPLHLLGHVKAPWTATFRGFHALAVDNPGRWSGLASLPLAHPSDQSAIDRAP